MNRRAFIGGAVAGAVAGAAAAIGGRKVWDRKEPEPAPAPAPPGPSIAYGNQTSYSQQGEDIVLYHLLHNVLKLKEPTYMDVGAADPIKGNNTYLLYGTGSRGVLVEPNPMYVAQLRAQRPEDKVVAAGIGVTDTAEADYYEIKGSPMLNTFSAEQVQYLQKGKTESVVERVVKMPLININHCIQEQLGKSPDLLSTDIEGMDYAILKTLDLSRFRPGVICTEGVSMYKDGKQSRITEYLMSQGYIVRGGSTVNTFYVDARRIEA